MRASGVEIEGSPCLCLLVVHEGYALVQGRAEVDAAE